MTTAQVVETSVTVTNSSFQNYTHPDDHTTRTTDTPGFKPFTKLQLYDLKWQITQIFAISVHKYHKSLFKVIWPFYDLLQLYDLKYQKTHVSTILVHKYHKSFS